jgi:uncharacterized repeat protein (TIGR01451 family)
VIADKTFDPSMKSRPCVEMAIRKRAARWFFNTNRMMWNVGIPMIRSILTALGVAVVALLPNLVQAQGAPFVCNDDLYQVRAGGTPQTTALLRFPQSVLTGGGGAVNVWGAINAPGINAIGLRQQDGFIYGINTATGLPQLYRLGQTTSALVGTIVTTGAQTPALTNTFVPTAGTFDNQGRYYFAGQDTNIVPSAIYRVDNFTTDVDPGTAGVQLGVAAIYPLSATLTNIGDFAFGPDGNLYGATGTTFAQIRLPATPGTATVTTATVTNVGGIGSAFFSNAGDLYVYDNTAGTLRSISGFQFGTAFPGAPVVSASITITPAAPVPATTAASDGASCVLPSTDMTVSLNLPAVLAPGSTVNGTVVCTNNGPSAAATVTCNATGAAGVTVNVGACTPTTPVAALRAIAGQNTITCPISFTVPGTAGGSNTGPTSVSITGTTSTVTTETNTGNNTQTVTPPIIDARDDNVPGTINGATGGVAVANVLGNDDLGTVNGPPLANVTLTQVSTTNPGLTLNPATGAVSVAPGTAAGTYTLVYQICAPPPTNVACDTASVTVTVVNTSADLQLTKTNTPGVNGNVDQAADTVTSGTTVQYNVVLTNNGPSPANGSLITDPAPTNLNCSTASCSATGGAVCPAATGAALVAALQGTGAAVPTLPNGGSVTITLTCTVP